MPDLTRHRAVILVVFVAALLALHACAVPAPRDTGIVASPWQPPADAERWTVVPEASVLRVTVHPAGPLEKFGHSHAVEFPVHGDVYRGTSMQASAFRLVVPVLQAAVDEPAARRAAGLDKDISASARKQTRANMLGGELLAADEYPRLVIESLAIRGEAPALLANMLVHVAGRIFEVSLPFRVRDEAGRLHARVNATLTQTDIGLEPYNALGGGLQVRDEMDIHLEILAVPAHDPQGAR